MPTPIQFLNINEMPTPTINNKTLLGALLLFASMGTGLCLLKTQTEKELRQYGLVEDFRSHHGPVPRSIEYWHKQDSLVKIYRKIKH